MKVRYVLGLLLVFVVTLVTACGDTSPAPEPESTATQSAAPTAAEAETTPTSAVTPAPETDEYPAPDATVDTTADDYPAPDTQTTEGYPAPGDCEIEVSDEFVDLLESQPDLRQTLGCPTAAAVQTQAAWQVFESEHQMVWLANDDSILAMYEGQWHGFEDTFDEAADPERPPDAPTPPSSDLLEAERGFGKVWVDRVDEIGFAVSEEQGYDATVQQFEGGMLVTTPYGQVFTLEGVTDTQSGSGPYQAWLERDGGWVSGAEAD